MIRWTQQIIWIERGSAALAGIGFGLVLAVLGNWLSQTSLMAYLPLIVLVTGILWLLAFLLHRRRPRTIDLQIWSPLALGTPAECDDYARQAFVGFVPLYTPAEGSPARALSPSDRERAIDQLDFDRLFVEQSNLQPTIHAILCHRHRLKHCWLVGTHTVQGGAQSVAYARLLVEYLRQKKGIQCEFHYGDKYTIELDEDALVFDKTHRRITSILEEIRQLGIPARDVVADITPGIRSMAMGMILACLDGDHDVELIGSKYNAKTGRPEGALTPLIFRFEPRLVAKS